MESVKQKSGIILIDKTEGLTSRQVVNSLSYNLSTKKVGHIGTLDPFATGLLILTINQATKIGAYLEALDKTYVARLKLGEKTDTGDLTGEIIERKRPAKSLDSSEISAIMASFLGKRKQIPPMFSALKRDGKPLYKYARQGLTVDREPRDIEVYEINLISFENEMVEFSARVSKGTYLRTLGEEIAEALGTVGHLVSLRRTAIGRFTVDRAIKAEGATYDDAVSIGEALRHLPQLEIGGPQLLDVTYGKPISLNLEAPLVLFLKDEKALALYEKREDGLYYCRRGIFE
ncbi:MAG: tRNA pseudouridine(55) synthase TruB [Bacilli bacterium]